MKATNEAGPVSGAGARVPTATTVIFRLPSAVVIASHNLRPAVGLTTLLVHRQSQSCTFAPSPSARRESLRTDYPNPRSTLHVGYSVNSPAVVVRIAQRRPRKFQARSQLEDVKPQPVHSQPPHRRVDHLELY